MPKKKTNPLGDYLTEQRGSMSRRQAAKKAGVSESRYRQIEAGYEQVAPGYNVDVNPRPATLAKICAAIGADLTKALTLAGFDDAEKLASSIMDDADLVASMPERVRVDWFSKKSASEREAILAELQRVHIEEEVRSRSAG